MRLSGRNDPFNQILVRANQLGQLFAEKLQHDFPTRFREEGPCPRLQRRARRAAQVFSVGTVCPQRTIVLRAPTEAAQDAERLISTVVLRLAAANAGVFCQSPLGRKPQCIRDDAEIFKRDLVERFLAGDLSSVIL